MASPTPKPAVRCTTAKVALNSRTAGPVAQPPTTERSEKPAARRRRVSVFIAGRLCASGRIVHLEATTELRGEDREPLETLCRCLQRPPLADRRLRLLPESDLDERMLCLWFAAPRRERSGDHLRKRLLPTRTHCVDLPEP
jgi:hypothetical protein